MIDSIEEKIIRELKEERLLKIRELKDLDQDSDLDLPQAEKEKRFRFFR